MPRPPVTNSRHTPWKGAKRKQFGDTAKAPSADRGAVNSGASKTGASTSGRGGGYRPPSTVQDVEDRAAAAARRAEQLAELRTAAQQGLTTAQGWRGWLDFAIRFPQQSLDNTLLLLAQRPDATRVAGYEDWQILGRNVVKGEKGLQLLGPEPRGGGRRQAVHVWDIAQTSPTPGAAYSTADPDALPTANRTVDAAEVPPQDTVTRALTELAGQMGYRIERGPTGTASARTDHDERVITVAHFTAADHPDARVSLAREVAGVLSSARPTAPEDAGRAEFEAASVAYLLAARHGLPTEHLFPGEETGTPPWRYVHSDGWSVDETYFPRQEQQREQGEGYDPRAEEVLGPVRDEQVLAMARRVTATSTALGEVVDKALAAAAAPPPVPAAVTAVAAASVPMNETVVAGDVATDEVVVAVAQTAPRDLTRDLNREAADLARSAATLRERAEVVAAAAAKRGQEQEGGQPPELTPELVARAEQLREVHAQASAFYREQLTQSAGPRAYLEQRGLSQTVIAGAGLGFAPDRWTGLTDHLRERGVDDATLIEAGLSVRSRQGKGPLVDRFRNRLMFPVRDHEGREVAFIGRAAPGEQDVAKYLNSPETLIHRKRELLYGFGESRQQLADGAPVVIVEGPMDRLAILTAMERADGVPGAPQGGADEEGVAQDGAPSDGVARVELRYVPVVPGGTAITPDQLAALDATYPLADRRVIVATDDDRAGREAAQRLWPMLRSLGAWPEHVAWSGGGDPAAQLVEQGAGSVTTDLLQAQDHPLVDSLIDWTVERFADRMGESAIPLVAARACFPVLREVPAEHQNAKLGATLSRINTMADLPLDPMAFYEDFLQVTSPERVGEAWGRLDEHIGQHSAAAPTDVLEHAVPGAVVEPAVAAPSPSSVGVSADRPDRLNPAQQAQLGQLPFTRHSGGTEIAETGEDQPVAVSAGVRTSARTR